MRLGHRSLLLGIALAAAPVHAAPVHIMLSAEEPAYRQVAAATAAALSPTAHTVSVFDAPVPDDAVVVIAVGTAATRYWFEAGDARPLVATLVPAAAWRDLDRPGDERYRTAIFLDQPLERHAALVRVLLPPAREVGIVVGPTSASMLETLQAAATKHQLRLHASEAATPDAVTGAVQTVLRRSEVLLALPDPAIFNRFTVQTVLLSTFRMRKPVIGFSESWVRAGALGAVHSTPEQLGTEAGELVARWLPARGELPAARHPFTYTVSVNRQVAVSLGIHLPTDAVLMQRFASQESEP